MNKNLFIIISIILIIVLILTCVLICIKNDAKTVLILPSAFVSLDEAVNSSESALSYVISENKISLFNSESLLVFQAYLKDCSFIIKYKGNYYINGNKYDEILSCVNENIEVSINPPGGIDETYYFIVSSDGKFSASKGTRNQYDITKKPYLQKTVEFEEIVLSSFDVSKIYDLINEIYEGEYADDIVVLDSWDIQILYKNEVIKQFYYSDMILKVKELVDELIRLSPVKVDLHGWS